MTRVGRDKSSAAAKSGVFAACLVAAAISSPASSAMQIIEAVPNGWRLENYPGDGVVLWYTGAPCGSVHFGGTATTADRNRLWAIVSTGKAAGRVVGIQFDNSSCDLASFYLREN